jgi:hypothetical protein
VAGVRNVFDGSVISRVFGASTAKAIPAELLNEIAVKMLSGGAVVGMSGVWPCASAPPPTPVSSLRVCAAAARP